MADTPTSPVPGEHRSTLAGWRIWRLSGGRLASWAMGYVWVPGPNTASCLRAELDLDDHRTPGTRCRCGFWALFDPRDCMALLKNAQPADAIALGLIHAWGDIAIHGKEGFRAEHARIDCLFSDRLMTRVPRWVTGLDERRWTFRARFLRQAAERYGVPLLSLREASSNGVLAEFGVTASPERLRAP